MISSSVRSGIFPLRAWGSLVHYCIGASEIRVRVFQVEFLDPGIAITHIMAFALQLEAAWLVGNAFAPVVASVNARVRAAPDLVDRLIGVHLLSVEIHREHRFLDALALREPRRAKHNIVSIPFPNAVVSVIRRLCFVDYCAHAMFGLVAVEHLNLVTVLEVNTAVAARLHDEEL